MRIFQEMPRELSDMISEYQKEGCRIVSTTGCDDFVWLVSGVVQGEEWIIYISWHEGERNFNIVNITGNAFEYLEEEMAKDVIRCQG